MNIRKATSGDLKILSQMATETFVKTYVSLNPENTELLKAYASETFNESKIEQELAKKSVTFYLVTDGSEFLGYAKTVVEGARLEVEKLYITGGTQGMGLGQKMFGHILEQAKAKGIKTLWLNVYDQNAGAIRFYSRLGFHKVGERDFKYVWNGQNYKDNDWVMELYID